jgi:hypothetical protein
MQIEGGLQGAELFVAGGTRSEMLAGGSSRGRSGVEEKIRKRVQAVFAVHNHPFLSSGAGGLFFHRPVG